MNDVARPDIVACSDRSASRWSRGREPDLVVLPLLLLGLAAAWLVVADPLRAFNNGAPPVEKLTFERTILDAMASTSWFAPAAPSR